MTENGVAQVPPDEDRTPTQEDAPPVTPPNAWSMPEPEFRRSDGYTPGTGWVTGDNESTAAEPGLHVSEDASVDVNPAPIAEQPDPDEVIEASDADAKPAPVKKKGGFFRVLLIILGIVAIALVTAAIVTALVLWYFFQVSESQNLN